MNNTNNNSNIFSLIFSGIKEIIASFYYVFVLAISGIKNIIIAPFNLLFNAASSKVDKVYQSAKNVSTPINVSNSKTPSNGPLVIPSTNKVSTNKSFLAKLISFLNQDIGGGSRSKEKRLSQKQITKLEEKRHELQKELTSPNLEKYKTAKVFTYKAKTSSGKWVSGRFFGFSKLDVNAYLLNEGYDVYEIENNKWVDFIYGQSKFGTKKMSTKDLIFWLTQLSTYVKAGITLSDSVKIIMNQEMKNKTKLGIYQSIAYELTMGNSFSDALAKQGDVFPAFLTNMLKAAEATGELEETLDEMVDYYSDLETTRKEMISALTYPALVSTFAIGVIMFVLLYVIPKFDDIYRSMGANVSGLTLFLLNASKFMKQYGLLILLIIVTIIIIIYISYKNVKAFRQSMQTMLMKFPVIGNIIIYKEMTTFARTFSSLLKNSVDLTKSIDILSKITSNEIYKNIMVETIENISKGDKISDAFRDHWAIPDVAYYMITTGESTGQLAEMMDKVGTFYQEQHHNIITNLKSLIEPVIIVFLAVIVGTIIVAVIVPMFQMYNKISFG